MEQDSNYVHKHKENYQEIWNSELTLKVFAYHVKEVNESSKVKVVLFSGRKEVEPVNLSNKIISEEITETIKKKERASGDFIGDCSKKRVYYKETLKEVVLDAVPSKKRKQPREAS